MTVELPLECTHPAAQNVRGMRLFACYCVSMVLHTVKHTQCRNAVAVARRWANQEAGRAELVKAYLEAQAIAVSTGDLVDAACAACAAYRANVPVANPDSEEAACLFAARVAQTAVRLARINAGHKPRNVDNEMLIALRRFLPELFHLPEQDLAIRVG